MAPLKEVAASPNKLASRFACEALKILGEQIPYTLSSHSPPLWSKTDVQNWLKQVCLYVYVSMSLCLCFYVYVSMSMSLCIYVNVSMYLCLYVNVSMSLCLCLYVNVSMSLYILYICLYVSMSLCLCLYLYVVKMNLLKTTFTHNYSKKFTYEKC